MLNRTIVVPFGMLHSVDSSPFMGKILGLAKAKDPDFTPELQGQCYAASAKFNLGRLNPADFKKTILTLLGKIEVDDETFWKDWNSVVHIDKDKTDTLLADLNKFCADNNCRLVFISDTNWMHFHTLHDLYKKNNHEINSDANNNFMIDNTFYLMLSCRSHMSRFELIKLIAGEDLFTVKTAHTDLVFGDPSNIAAASHRAVVEKELAGISKWCSENGVSVTLHSNGATLLETLKAVVAPNREYVQSRRC